MFSMFSSIFLERINDEKKCLIKWQKNLNPPLLPSISKNKLDCDGQPLSLLTGPHPKAKFTTPPRILNDHNYNHSKMGSKNHKRKKL